MKFAKSRNLFVTFFIKHIPALACSLIVGLIQQTTLSDTITPDISNGHDYFGNFLSPPDSSHVKYRLVDLGKTWADDKPQVPTDANGNAVVQPPNATGNYHISTTPRTSGDLRLPALNSVTYGTNSTNLLPSNLTNQDSAFSGFYYPPGSNYGAVAPTTDIVGVTTNGLVIGKLDATRIYEGWVGRGDTNFHYQNPYPTLESPAYSTPSDVFFTYDTNSKAFTKLKDYSYNWQFNGQYYEKTPSQVAIQGYNNHGEFVGMSSKGLEQGLAVYYSSPDATPQLLQSLIESSGPYIIGGLSGIDDNGVVYGSAKLAQFQIGRDQKYIGIDHYIMLVPIDGATSGTMAPAPVPVPEPSTWLVGLGLMAAMVIRRQVRCFDS